MKEKDALRQSIEDGFKNISKQREVKFVDISARPDPGQPITADTVDDYMEANGYKRLDTAWIELSRKSAVQHIELIMRGEQINWFPYDFNKELPHQLATQFVDFFDIDARFFTHGLSNILDEHPVIDSRTGETKVVRPFLGIISDSALYHSSYKLTDSMFTSPTGLIAIDQTFLGYIFIPPSVDA